MIRYILNNQIRSNNFYNKKNKRIKTKEIKYCLN